MRFRPQYALMAVLALVLTACGNGPVKRVSEPAASIQQINVLADGSWDIQLRLQNFSSMAMRFDSAALALSSNSTEIGQLQASPALSVGPESADVFTLRLPPSAQGRLLAAGVLADGLGLPYRLLGEVHAAPSDGRSRRYPIDARSTLHPAPGLPGVLR